MKTTILMTCVGGTMGPDLLIHLREDPSLKPRLVGVDVSESAKGRFYVDAFYQVPWGEADNYIESVVRIVKAEHVNAILPGSDQEAFVLSKHRDLLRKAGAVVMTSPIDVLYLIKDKQATYQALEAKGIRVPDYIFVSRVDELESALSNFGYPSRSVIVKPVAGRGGRGLLVLTGENDLPPSWIGGGARETRLDRPPEIEDMNKWFDLGPLLVMPVLKDPAYDVDLFAIKGKAKHALVRKRINPAGIPFAGNCVIADTPIRDYCLEIAEAIGLDGIHDIDLMTDDEGRPALLEINPRMSGSAVAAHAAGFPIISAAIAEFLGIQYPITAPAKNIDVGLIPRAVVVGGKETK